MKSWIGSERRLEVFSQKKKIIFYSNKANDLKDKKMIVLRSQFLQKQNYKQFKIRNKKMQYMDVLLSYTESSDPQEIFQLLDILGQGAYGSVSKALHKQTGQLYAIKILPATSVNQIAVIKKQIAILRECNDEHIVKYYGSYFKDNNLWIVMEYCMAGSITDIVNITDKQLNENEIASILESVLHGLKYLHDRKKIHRDIKAANILLDQNGNAKLADFGVSTEMMYTNARHNTHIGSPYWMSPQVIKYSEYNQKTDIWSLGVTAIELAEGVVPYSHLKPFMAMWTMKDKPIQGFKEPQKWSAEFNDFVKQCLQINPQMRPDAETLLHHDFLRKKSQGKKILAELVQNSMMQIQNFRAGQAIKQQQSFSKSQLKEFIFARGDSNGTEYETNTVIVKNSNKKNNQSVDSMIEHAGIVKKIGSNLQSANKSMIQNDQEVQCGSVIIRNDNDKGHSRNCSQISVSSVLVKDDNPSEPKSKQNSNYLQNYIQNMQAMHSKQQEFKQTVQQKILKIEQNFIKNLQTQYTKVKNQLRQFFIAENTVGKPQKQQTMAFKSELFSSQSVLDFLYKHSNFEQQRQKLEDQFKEKYLSNIHPVDNNYMSMMLESGNDDGSGEFNNVMQIIDGDDNIFLKNSVDLGHQCRKKSQSSADSPTSLFNNRKKNVKKLIIQESLENPNVLLSNEEQNRDTSSVNTDKNSRSQQKIHKQSSINKFLQKTPLLSQNQNKNSRYKEIFVNSANITGTNNKNFVMSTTNYSNSTTTNMRGLKRVITTQPHEAYDYENDSLSTLTKLNHRNLKQFYDDPVVFNNLKQLTQQSEEFSPTISLNPFELKKNSFSKEIKSVKSKQRQKDKIFVLRQKQRATHIAHTAMAHNKQRTVNNSSKKLKVIKVLQERQKSPDESGQMAKLKSKKSKSKNKQTASTTIPFGSVGNMGALEYLPAKLGKSKQKKPSQIPVKSGPFSKIKSNKY